MDINKEIKKLEAKVKSAEKAKTRLDSIRYLKEKYSPKDFFGYDCVYSPHLLEKCNKLSIYGKNNWTLKSDLYFKDKNYTIIGNRFVLADIKYIGKTHQCNIFNYEEEIPKDFPNRALKIKKIEKDIFSFIKKNANYRNAHMPQYDFVLNKNSFNFDKFEGYLIFS